jgi:hypothetical protein
LADHGIQDYGKIKEIVSFQIPQTLYFFSVRFGRRTLEEVLTQIERWKKFLKTDFLLLYSEKTEAEKWIVQTQRMVCNALVQANLPKVGDWELRYNWIPTGEDEAGNPVFIWPSLKITACRQQSGEIRTASIPAKELYASNLGANAYQKAFEDLGLWEMLQKGSLRHHLISARKPQGWPMYARIIVPQLYEFLAPHYRQRGHYSETTNKPNDHVRARFPKELLQDMLEILRIEHPQVFARTTIDHLKATVQRHLSRNAKSIKSGL